MSASYGRWKADTHDIDAEENVFTTLVESRAVRRRNGRGVVASVLLHTLLIVGGIALTHAKRGEANSNTPPQTPLVFIPVVRPHTLTHQVAESEATKSLLAPNVVSIPVPTVIPTSIPSVDIVQPAVAIQHIALGGPGLAPPHGVIGGPSDNISPSTILDARAVDRIPGILGNAPAPHYPDVLRQSGLPGNAIARFVVDTLGRAEMDDVTIVEATHPLFASAVKSVLPLYRFSPGEAGGRKVRTLVQIPFSFTLR